MTTPNDNLEQPTGLSEELAQVRTDLGTFREQNATLTTQLNQAKAENTRLTATNRELTATSTELQTSADRVPDLETQLAASQEINTKFQERMTTQITTDLLAKGVKEEALKDKTFDQLEMLSNVIGDLSISDDTPPPAAAEAGLEGSGQSNATPPGGGDGLAPFEAIAKQLWPGS